MSHRPDRIFYEEAAKREILYTVCEYVRGDECSRCPEWETIDGEQCKRMCFALPQEVIALVLEDEALRRAMAHIE